MDMQKLTQEIARFMRGKYRLDEVGDGNNELKFKQGKKTILTVYIHESKYTFLVIFGKYEREKFEVIKSGFSQYIINYYDNSKTYHDGKWLYIDVSNLDEFEEIKKLIYIKKNPNRKPFPKDGAFYSLCGHRCDLCVQYTGCATEEFREKLGQHITNVYGGNDNSHRCSGCSTENCHIYDGSGLCEPLKCANEKSIKSCMECIKYPCYEKNAGYQKLESRNIPADDVTWAILPYVPYQYEQ